MQSLVQIISDDGSIPLQDAQLVFDTYKRMKLVYVNPSHGYEVKHGGIFDKETINRALKVYSKSFNVRKGV